MNLNNFFRGNLIGSKIKDFPYPDRYCTYCNKKCDLVDAIHMAQHPENYKALYICQNPRCEAYDEPARAAYARVYYSSNEAFENLEVQRIWYERNKI
jgi:hypothetical protein